MPDMQPAPAATVEELAARVSELEQRLERAPDPDALTILVFSDGLDRLLAAFNIATSAAALGKDVTMFFTFWGTPAMRRKGARAGGKSVVEGAFGRMLPGHLDQTRLSKLEMLGMGRWLMTREMQRKNVRGLGDMLETAGELGVRIAICEATMSLMGIREEELVDYPNRTICGATSFVEMAMASTTTLFV